MNRQGKFNLEFFLPPYQVVAHTGPHKNIGYTSFYFELWPGDCKKGRNVIRPHYHPQLTFYFTAGRTGELWSPLLTPVIFTCLGQTTSCNNFKSPVIPCIGAWPLVQRSLPAQRTWKFHPIPPLQTGSPLGTTGRLWESLCHPKILVWTLSTRSLPRQWLEIFSGPTSTSLDFW